MSTTTWWGVIAVAVLMSAIGAMFIRYVVRGNVKTIESFRRWTAGTAVASAVLVLLAAIPVKAEWPTLVGLQDVTAVANAVGPLLLSVSVTLASIFYSAGDWYEAARKFRQLGIKDARSDRKGRQLERAVFWQNVLKKTDKRIVISGTTLGGWFDTFWEETRDNLLNVVLKHARVQVLLADPAGTGFALRADDPAEVVEAERRERARSRAKRVYERIADILDAPEFRDHVGAKRLEFFTYQMTPLSVVWVDDQIYFTTYLPFVGDSDCPEFTLSQGGEMGLAISAAIEELLRKAKKIEASIQARELAAVCGNE